jgi:uncharacterized membrane protein YhaH (DUF805 family)
MNLFLEIFVRRLFSFKGRASRREYIIRFFTMLLLNAISIYTLEYTNHVESISIFILDSTFFIISIIYLLQVFFVTHRRLHDLNASGWWQLITLIPCGQILMLGFIFFKGTQGTNKYGAEPKY